MQGISAAVYIAKTDAADLLFDAATAAAAGALKGSHKQLANDISLCPEKMVDLSAHHNIPAEIRGRKPPYGAPASAAGTNRRSIFRGGYW